MWYVLPLVLCQLVVPVVTGTRRLEKEDASAQGAMVNSTAHNTVTYTRNCINSTEGCCVFSDFI
jgi:hypothetical protein